MLPKDIIISIKSQFCKEIYAGRKTIELRRKIGNGFTKGARLYIYSSRSDMGVTGEAIISDLAELPVGEIKEKYLKMACISEGEFDSYYQGCTAGFAICLSDVIKYKEVIRLVELKRLGFKPPQSFLYAGLMIRNYIEEHKCI